MSVRRTSEATVAGDAVTPVSVGVGPSTDLREAHGYRGGAASTIRDSTAYSYLRGHAAAVCFRWSNGRGEGQVNRLELMIAPATPTVTSRFALNPVARRREQRSRNVACGGARVPPNALHRATAARPVPAGGPALLSTSQAMPSRRTAALAATLATVLAMTHATPAAAQAAAAATLQTFAFSFVSGSVVATGVLVATANGDGSFTAIRGGGILSGAGTSGALTLVPNPNPPGTQRSGSYFFYDDQLFPGAVRSVDYDGLLFNLPNGYQAALYTTDPSATAASVFRLVEGTPAGVDVSRYDAPAFTLTAAPEPATWTLAGVGLLALGGLARRRARIT